MLVLQDSIVEYIFLSREIPLPLAALKIIKKRISFEDVMNFSENKFKSLLFDLRKKDKILLKDIDQKVANFVNKKNNSIFRRIERDLEICDENDIKCMSYFDKEFPYILKIIKNPPKLIFMKGEIKPEDDKAVAIIGTRKPTPYGEKMAREIAKRLAEKKFTIVSGFARGIDTIAINSALENGGRAIGVIASGILNLYPKENRNYVNKLVSNGALISERFPEKSVTKRALQIRNRISSGLGLGNIFVEGTEYSGTVWQFKFGEEEGRPAFAVEPLYHECEQAYIPNWIINEKKGIKISNYEDIDFVAEMLLSEYQERKKNYKSRDKIISTQTSILKY